MVYNILDYGAVPDGTGKSTEAIQAAIDQCTRTGGQVLIPAGRFQWRICGKTVFL